MNVLAIFQTWKIIIRSFISFIFSIPFLVITSNNKAMSWIYASKVRPPIIPFHSVVTIDPFCKWGIDFIEYYMSSLDGRKYIFMAIDYFMRWVEATPTFNKPTTTTTYFFLKYDITYFGVFK